VNYSADPEFKIIFPNGPWLPRRRRDLTADGGQPSPLRSPATIAI
jgi:hypothetical protein